MIESTRGFKSGTTFLNIFTGFSTLKLKASAESLISLILGSQKPRIRIFTPSILITFLSGNTELPSFLKIFDDMKGSLWVSMDLIRNFLEKSKSCMPVLMASYLISLRSFAFRRPWSRRV